MLEHTIPEDLVVTTDPVTTVLQIAGGHCLPRCLHVIADLGVADALDDQPRKAEELASSVGAEPDALHRVLRLLAAHGVFECLGLIDQYEFVVHPRVVGHGPTLFAGLSKMST